MQAGNTRRLNAAVGINFLPLHFDAKYVWKAKTSSTLLDSEAFSNKSILVKFYQLN